MGHIAEPAGASGAVVVGCKVLPSFSERGMVEGAMKRIVYGKKAVARVLRRAAQASTSTSTSNSVSARKWKVLSFQARDADAAATTRPCPCDDTRKVSFKWDVGSCSSASSVLYSPMSAPAMSRQNSGVVYSYSPKKVEEPCRTGQWITTDSDFVVLEL